MPLYAGGNKNKRKGAQRGKGNAQKSGVKGIAAQYITRNKAIKKLQVSLKDFRSAETTGQREGSPLTTDCLRQQQGHGCAIRRA